VTAQTSAPPTRRGGALDILASRLIGHTAIYASGTAFSMAFAVVHLAVMTRLLDPSLFGALAILTLYSGLITLLCNLGTVQGTMASAFSGGAVGDGGADDDDGLELADTRPATDNRRRITTGFALTVCSGGILTLLSIPFAGDLSTLLVGGPEYAAAVVWATAAGGLGSLWRITSALPRMERRPPVFVGLQIGRSLLVLGFGALLIESGFGLTGAVAGVVLGKLVMIAVALRVSRKRFRLAISRDDARTILRNGRPLVLISVGFFVARNADLFVLSRYASNADVAMFRVAERMGQLPSFAVSAALIAWGPLLRGPMRVALERESAVDVARSKLVSYYVFLAVSVIVAIAMWADVLIRVAPPSYADATELLIVMAIASSVHGANTIVFRMTRFQGKIKAFRRIAVLTAAITVALALALVPPLGARGAAYATLLAPLPGVAIMLWRDRRGSEPLRAGSGRIAACIALGAAWVALGVALRDALPSLHVAIDACFGLGFPLLLVATRVIPPAEAKRLLALVLAPLRAAGEHRHLRARLAELDAADRDLVATLALRRERPSELAARTGETPDAVLARFVRVLRELDGVGSPTNLDSEIGRYLLSAQTSPQRDRMGHMLSLRKDAVPLELDRLTVVFKRVRAAC
jgi:O-antigen/teichoic acid export membrane protein